MKPDQHRLKFEQKYLSQLKKNFYFCVRLLNSKSVFVCVHLWLILLFFSTIKAQTYSNPVIPGDFPDPSVIRAGTDYYAAATTGDWAPHFQILHSRDLVNWEIAGAVLSETPVWAKGDFWAPEITEDHGRFFVYYTARRNDGAGKKGTLCVAVAVADKPAGPYTDKGTLVCQEMGSLDPDFTRDEHGKPYLIWKEDGNDRQQPTWLYAQELDASGTKLLGKAQKLFRNTQPWEKHVIEGAYVLRRDGYFYLFYSGNACCGRSCDYALGVARSKTLLGKWEKNPANPILAANETWQCPGHGSIVETPDNRSFLLYHAYGKDSGAFNIGREALLDEVKFQNGWATINDGRGPSKTAAAPLKNTNQQSVFADSNDEFGGNPLAPKWSFPLFNNETIRLKDGFLTIAPTGKQLISGKMSEVVLAERTVSEDYTATARIDFARITEEESAGLSAYSWRGNAVGISLGSGKIYVWRREEGKQVQVASAALPPSMTAVQLRLTAQGGETYNFAYSFDGKSWQALGDKVSFGNLEGARVALIDNGKTDNPGARFDWIRVEKQGEVTEER